AENRLCRTLVRRRDDFRRFCIFLSSRIGLSKKQRPKMDYAVRLYVIVRMTFFVVGFPTALLLVAKFCEKSSMKASPIRARLSCFGDALCAVKL
ncbi:MAG: hypothetical protein ACLTTQ_09300, partial [Christensenellales bacterium]